jgi:catechol 2,3-dioxygenase-like lactoylglutathione lyase family enzyme
MPAVHHSAVCVRDLGESLRFWRDGLGLSVLMDHRFEGDWPTLLRAPQPSLRAVFLGDPAAPSAGVVELVDLGPVPAGANQPEAARSGFLLLSLMTDVTATLERLRSLGVGGEPRRTTVSGVDMAVVVDPDGVLVELVDTAANANLDRLVGDGGPGSDAVG